MKEQLGIHPDISVNEAIQLHPITVEVFNRFGIDSCCGGALPIRIAAERHELELEGLLEALREAADERS
jgi:iron-sulfur cluster repair protein YtfE (RIC family)